MTLAARSNEARKRNLMIALCTALMAIGVWLALGPWIHTADAFDPPPEFTTFTMTPSNTQAGGHPDVAIKLAWAESFGQCEGRCRFGRNIDTHFPTGFIGNPHVAPKCTLTEFNRGACPVDAQVGTATVVFGLFVPLYNMETRPDQAGLVAFLVPLVNAPVFLELGGRTDSDYGLDAKATPIPQLISLGNEGIGLDLWGVPADPVNDDWRFKTPLEGGGCVPIPPACDAFVGAKATIPPAPYLQNPTACGGVLSSRADLRYYDGAEVHAEHAWPPMTGCNQLSFDPSQTVQPTTTAAETASGADVELRVPQTQSPSSPTPSQIRTNTVLFPPGMTINPNAADGKVACADAETSIGTLFAAQCPEFSKVGTTEVESSALPGPLHGGLYIGEPKPGEPYRLILTASGFATHIKLPISVHADPVTGRLMTVVEQPQSPIDRVRLHIFGSERGVFATPERCGTFAVETEFVPWNEFVATQTLSTFFPIDSGPSGTACPNGARPFNPSVRAGSANNTAAGFAPFSLVVNRDDGNQYLTGLDVLTPVGLSASLKGIPYCSEAVLNTLALSTYTGRAEQAESACPSSSQVGTVTTGAGAGTQPLFVSGKVFLAGPYKGAPLSLAIVVPAVSGPYDLGNVVVRVALHVDPLTAQVSAIPDPLPEILEGVPLRLRSVLVNLNRPDFVVNPTDCSRSSVSVEARGREGGIDRSSHHFQVANCAALPFEPKLSMTLRGGTNRLGHPSVHAVLQMKPGEANAKAISVTLPKGQLLDNSHIRAICTRVEFARDACPGGSRLGHVEATSPLLDAPLEGDIYLRSSSHELPDLALDLEGQFEIEAAGQIDSVNGRLRTRFESIPDVPVSRIELDLVGGRKGLLQNTESLCRKSKRAKVKMRGHNGAHLTQQPKLTIHCIAKKRAKKAPKIRIASGKGR